MPKVCFYLHLHQPYRLRKFNVFNIGHQESYFADKKNDANKNVFLKVAQKSYFPMLSLIEQILSENDQFRMALSISGIFIEQAQEYCPEVLTNIKKLVKTGRVEILAETYYHSLAFLYSPEEFNYQIKKHTQLIQKVFKEKPRVFRNTELIYSNYIAQLLEKYNFKGILTEAVDYYLQGRKRTQIFVSKTKKPIPLLLKHARLSDDIAFRFGSREWQWYPLSAGRYLDWVEVYSENEIVNLFMDFETFGEHQWEDTGIFEFFADFVKRFSQKSYNKFYTPSELFDEYKKQSKSIREKAPIYDVNNYISWADVDRSITAWRDNSLQFDTLKLLYDLREKIISSKDKQLIEDWRRLQTSDHFYYMCTKWSADGDVHAYFSPYRDPYEAYRRFCVVFADLQERMIPEVES